MARHPDGWTLLCDPRTGIYTARWSHAGRRYHRSTGTSDRREAQRRAGELYQAAVSGRVARLPDAVPLAGLTVEEVAGGWLAAEEAAGRRAATLTIWTDYARAHWMRLFADAAEMASPLGLARYVDTRLGEVTASTVRKECSALAGLLRWCARPSVGLLTSAPEVPRPSREQTGKRAQTVVRVDLTPAQVEALIEALPVELRAAPGTTKRRPCRALFRVLWETGLRIGTLRRLEAPGDYHRGAEVLRIRDEADKSAFARTVPLSARAREALDEVCPRSGLLFPALDARAQLEKAALAIGLPPHLAGHVSHHDLRHARTTALLDAGAPLTGVAYLVGHRRVTTTDLYAHARPAAARAALATDTGHRDGHHEAAGRKKKAPEAVAAGAKEPTIPGTLRKRGLEPPQPFGHQILRPVRDAEARDFSGVLRVRLVSGGHELPDTGHGVRLADRLVEAALEVCRAVEEGDPHRDMRALELAALVAEMAEAEAEAAERNLGKGSPDASGGRGCGDSRGAGGRGGPDR